MARQPLNPDLIERAISIYRKSNKSIAAVAAECGMSHTTLAKHLIHRGLSRTTNASRVAARAERCKKIQALLQAGHSPTEVAEQLGLARTTVMVLSQRFKLFPMRKPYYSHIVARLDRDGHSIESICTQLNITRDQVTKALHYWKGKELPKARPRLPALGGWHCPYCPERFDNGRALMAHKKEKH